MSASTKLHADLDELTITGKFDRLEIITDMYLKGDLEPKDFVQLQIQLRPNLVDFYKSIAAMQRECGRGPVRRAIYRFLGIP